MLNMSGRPALNMADNVAALVLSVALTLWLIPPFGIVGAAVAWAASLALVNLARLLQVRWVLHALPFDAGVIKGAVAGAVTLAAALATNQLMQPAGRLAVEIVVTVAVYAGTLFSLGLTEEDRVVLGILSRRSPGRRPEAPHPLAAVSPAGRHRRAGSPSRCTTPAPGGPARASDDRLESAARREP
jgi:hypothetical protein